jgi:hypothetical protein
MNCPTCGKPGYEAPALGRPKELDDEEVKRLRAEGLTLRQIGEKLGVVHSAVLYSLARSKKGTKKRK